MDEAEILKKIRADAREDMQFHSNAGKAERERWVVGDFLRVLDLTFSSDELISPNQHSPVDVVFRDAQFQVKEIPDPAIRRGALIRETFIAVSKAARLEEIILPFTESDTPAVTRIYDLVRERAEELARSGKYSKDIASLDLIFYVTRTHAGLIQSHEIHESDFALLGWRSVSCLAGNHAAVLFASKRAPLFMHPAPRLISAKLTAS